MGDQLDVAKFVAYFCGMRQATVRISVETRALLKNLAREERLPMRAVLQNALEEYRRRRFLDEVNRGYAALGSDRQAWKAELEERAVWDRTIADGLAETPKMKESPARYRKRKPRSK